MDRYKPALWLLGLTCLLVPSIRPLMRFGQWDFSVYYYSALAWRSGANPYDHSVLAGYFARFPASFNYVYTPLSLLFFSPFTFFGYTTAAAVFLALKCAAAGALFLLLSGRFTDGRKLGLFAVFFAFAYSRAVHVDLRAGNISLFEQLLIWLAFSALLKDKLGLFSGLILLSSVFKLVPAGFLPLILLSSRKDRLSRLFYASAAFAMLSVLSYLLFPAGFRGFIANAGALDERMWPNPSMLAFIKDIFRLLWNSKGIRLPDGLAMPAYLAVCAAVIAAAVRRAAGYLAVSERSEERQKTLLFFYCLTYALILPRFKDYSYILLIAPAFALTERSGPVRYLPLAAALPVYLFASPELLKMDSIRSLVWNYWSLIAAFAVWTAYVVSMNRSRKTG